MANPTKDEFIAYFDGIMNGALGGISGSTELSDEELATAAEQVYGGINTVAPNKGVSGIKYGVTGGGL